MDKNRYFAAYGRNYTQMAYDVLSAAQVEKMIPSKNSRVLIKPNLVVAVPAEDGATTHTQVVEGAILYLKEKGFENLVIAEGSWVGDRTSRAFKICGYEELARRTGVDLVDTQKDSHRKINCAGMELSVCESALKADFILNVPVLKGHCQLKMTCALKNLKGLIPNSEKRRFHTMGVTKPIAHLSAGLKQGFVLVDAICGDLDFEEGGNPIQRDQVLGFYDPVLCDTYACAAMGFDLGEIPCVPLAEKLGIGSTNLSAAKLVEVNRPEPAKQVHPTRRVAQLEKYADARDACSACYANLIYALNRLDNEGLLYSLPDKVLIGQAAKGVKGKIGVGRCAAGCDMCLQGCPPSAADMLRFLEELSV